MRERVVVFFTALFFLTLFTVLIMKGRYIIMKIEDYTFIEKAMLLVIGTMLWSIQHWYISLLLIFYYIVCVIGL